MMFLVDELRELVTNGQALSYKLRRTGRQRTIGIFVEPDRRVLVLAPVGVDGRRVDEIVTRRLRWIRRQVRTLEALPPPPAPREWVAGETHRYIGRQYRLKLIKAEATAVRLTGGHFVVTLPDPGNRTSVQRLMNDWYRLHATSLLADRAARAITATSWLEVKMPPIVIRALRQRWGSTTKAGRVYFNVDLVKLPLPCIDYVVAHELVHLVIPNHSPAFWRMLDRVMPDWKRWRERLARVEL